MWWKFTKKRIWIITLWANIILILEIIILRSYLYFFLNLLFGLLDIWQNFYLQICPDITREAMNIVLKLVYRGRVDTSATIPPDEIRFKIFVHFCCLDKIYNGDYLVAAKIGHFLSLQERCYPVCKLQSIAFNLNEH